MSNEIINEKNYSFYMFKCNEPEIINTYVGSTQNFRLRKSNHKYHCNHENSDRYNLQVYKTTRENGGWDNWKMVQIHEQLCKSRTHSKQIEQELIEEHKANMNMRRAFRTNEQQLQYQQKYNAEHTVKRHEYKQNYEKENADKIRERKKKYYIENTNKILERQRKYKAEKKLEKINSQVKETI